MAQDSKSRKLDQYIVRFPEGMRDRIKAEAEVANRSLNAEIIARLEAYDEFAKRLEDSEERLFIAHRERDQFEDQWKKMAAIVDKSIDLSKEKAILEAERQRAEAQKAAIEETKENIEREMKHLMRVHEENNAQLEALETLRAHALDLVKSRDSDQEKLIEQQAQLIKIVDERSKETARLALFMAHAIDEAANGNKKHLDSLISQAPLAPSMKKMVD